MTHEEFFANHTLEVVKKVVEENIWKKSDYFDTQRLESFSGTPVRPGIDVRRHNFIESLAKLLEAHTKA